jgi:RHS repeat-associated protein
VTSRNTTTFTYNNLNQLSGRQYDHNGSLQNDGSWYYDYDDENQLIRITQWYSGSLYKKSEFTYDGLGRRRIRREFEYMYGSWYQTEEVRYVYDGNLVIQERNGSGTPTVSYTRGSDLSGTFEGAGGIGGMLARSHGYSSGNWTSHNFYHSDGAGNITAMADMNGTVTASYKYDPFGRNITQSGTMAAANLYRFSSKELHPHSNFYYYLYRYYDSHYQRWINRDPLGEMGGINLFKYVENNPIMNVDPWGLCSSGCGGIPVAPPPPGQFLGEALVKGWKYLRPGLPGLIAEGAGALMGMCKSAGNGCKACCGLMGGAGLVGVGVGSLGSGPLGWLGGAVGLYNMGKNINDCMKSCPPPCP